LPIVSVTSNEKYLVDYCQNAIYCELLAYLGYTQQHWTYKIYFRRCFVYLPCIDDTDDVAFALRHGLLEAINKQRENQVWWNFCWNLKDPLPPFIRLRQFDTEVLCRNPTFIFAQNKSPCWLETTLEINAADLGIPVKGCKVSRICGVPYQLL